MSKTGKYSLINIDYIDFEFEEGDEIVFEMPSFCSGDYTATVHRDPKFGLYIDNKDNYFKGCRDFYVKRNNEILK